MSGVLHGKGSRSNLDPAAGLLRPLAWEMNTHYFTALLIIYILLLFHLSISVLASILGVVNKPGN